MGHEFGQEVAKGRSFGLLPVQRFWDRLSISSNHWVGKLAYAQVWTQMTNIGGELFQSHCGIAYGSKKRGRQSSLLHNKSQRLFQVGVVRDDDSVIEYAHKRIPHQMRAQIDV